MAMPHPISPPHTHDPPQNFPPDNDDNDGDSPFLIYKRIAVLGARGVGKSALSIRCALNKFESDYMLTFQDMYQWKPVVNGLHYDVNIDDTDGQDENSEFGMRYTTGIDGYVLVFSVRDYSSFQVIKAINEKLLDTLMVTNRKGVSEVPRVLVGNQIDIAHERQVPTRVAAAYAREQGIPYMESSAFTPFNVEAVFETILKIIQQNLHDSHTSSPSRSALTPRAPTVQPQSPHSCSLQ